MSLIIDKVDNSEAVTTVDNGSTLSNVHMSDWSHFMDDGVFSILFFRPQPLKAGECPKVTFVLFSGRFLNQILGESARYLVFSI